MMPETPNRPANTDLAVDVIVMQGNDDSWHRILETFNIPGLAPPSRFDAVDGKHLSSDKLHACLTPRAAYELSVGRRFPFGWVHEGVPSRGAVGCYLSHLEIWKRASERTVATLVLEQDAKPVALPGEISDAIASIPADADYVFLGHLALFLPRFMERFASKPVRGFHPVESSSDIFCTHAYVITPVGARKLVEKALPINSQVDCFVRFLATPESGVKVLYHSPSLVQQLPGIPSLIQLKGTTVAQVLQGGMMALRAVAGSVSSLLRRGGYFIWRSILSRQARS